MYSLRNTYQAQNTCIGSACSEGTRNFKFSSKHPLNGLDLAQIFTGNSVFIIELNCICLTNSRAIFGISVSGCGPGLPPLMRGNFRYIILWSIWSTYGISDMFWSEMIRMGLKCPHFWSKHVWNSISASDWPQYDIPEITPHEGGQTRPTPRNWNSKYGPRVCQTNAI